MTHAMEHCQRPWWKRPPVWFIATAVVLGLLIGVGAEIESTGKSAAMPYGAFLDQLEAGNVASASRRSSTDWKSSPSRWSCR